MRLPSTVSGPFLSLQWSTTSSRILLATADQINVFSARDASFHARIDNPLAGTAGSGGGGKQYFVAFGSGEAEIIVIAAFGLKILIFDLTISKAVELGNPKYYHPSSAGRCFSNRPASGHLALLTRSSGKDTISIHHPVSRKVQSTWDPDTVDAHSLVWTSDSQWLLLWDNPAYGHKLDLYTLEGHLVRTFNATDLSTQPDVGLALGIKLCLPSPDATLCAVGDGSPTVYVLRTDLWAVKLRLLHRTPIVPVDTMQVSYTAPYPSLHLSRATCVKFLGSRNFPPKSRSGKSSSKILLQSFLGAHSQKRAKVSRHKNRLSIPYRRPPFPDQAALPQFLMPPLPYLQRDWMIALVPYGSGTYRLRN